jgi:hypothetical protein
MPLRTCSLCAEGQLSRITVPMDISDDSPLESWIFEPSLKDCEVCSFLYECFPEQLLGDIAVQGMEDVTAWTIWYGEDGLRKMAGINANMFSYPASKETGCALMLLSSLPRTAPVTTGSPIEYLCTPPRTLLVFIPSEQWIPMTPTSPKVNIATLLGWMRELAPSYGTVSINSHHLDSPQDNTPLSTQPKKVYSRLKVIDCTSRTIVSAPEGVEYVTLSYTWGSSQAVDLHEPERSYTSQEALALPTILPNTIGDAVDLCLSLGFQYLWIDRYCIPQSEPEERMNQIQRMGEIYSDSILTIVACAGRGPHYGLPGISRSRRPCPSLRLDNNKGYLQMIPAVQDIHQSRWGKRGW